MIISDRVKLYLVIVVTMTLTTFTVSMAQGGTTVPSNGGGWIMYVLELLWASVGLKLLWGWLHR